MQRDSNFRAVGPAFAVAFGSFVGCTGYIEPSGSSAPAAASAAGASSQAGATAPPAAAISATPTASWPAAIGTWCGPVDKQTLWLTTKPQASACSASSQTLYADTSKDDSEGLALELDPAALTTFPAALDVPARYCATGGVCADVRASLQIESFTAGQGLRGTWRVTPPGQPERSGRVDASWCNWDDFLPPHPEAERLARDIKIQEVSVYQGVKVPIARDMQAVATRNADLVQQREALVRVFVQPAPGFQSRQLSARITLQDQGAAPRYFWQTIDVSGPSSEPVSASTFNIELPKDAFNPGTQYAVELRETSRCTALSGTPVGARFPETGLLPVGARATGPIKVMLVPVRYEADGSGRLPDTSPEQLNLMSRRLYAMYPTTDVMLSVRDVVGTDRTQLGDMLDQMRELRTSDAPPTDLAYYGLVRQAETFVDYCQGSCTTGIAGFGSMSGTASAGMGVGFPESAASTFVHELGHIYRRPHAPCGGAAAPDENYPYPNAGLGSWGYDLETRELFDPQNHVDFMSYCSPDWISDYNYQQILERIIVVNQRATLQVEGTAPGAPLPAPPPPGPAQAFRTLRVSKAGRASWGLELHARLAPPGDPIHLKALNAAGAVVEELAATFEDGPEGEQAYFIPAGHADWHAIQVPGGPLVSYAGTTQNKPFKR
jgi:Peptidase M66